MSSIEKMDRIILSPGDMDNLFLWRDNHKDYVRNFKPVLKEGVIEVGEFHRQVFEDKGNVVVYTVYNYVDNEYKKIYQLTWNKFLKTAEVQFSNFVKDFDTVEYNRSIISLHASMMAYMEYYGDKKEYVQSSRVTMNKPSKNRKKSSTKKKSPIKIRKTIYAVNVNKESTVMDKRRYERHMEKWNVKGHYRTYKSGKKVWIEPQVRGAGKEVMPKEYKM